ncbi:MAG TPA: GntP family permease [Clostridiaceae bacterium]|nr:GntP family permease [Clostridiaceae bacterium]
MDTQLILALVIGLALLIFLILKTKIHAFLALIISAIAIGIMAGLGTDGTVAAISAGFGGTLGNIGIIIGFGVMLGQIFQMSGAAERMARTFLKIFGKGKEEWALALTGFIVSIPIFCDSGFVILAPLARAISRASKKSMVSLGVALASGLVVTHSIVPPTPGPLGVAGIFDVDIGLFILIGIAVSIPIVIAMTIYAKWLGKQIYQLPEGTDGWHRPPYQEPDYSLLDEEPEKELPSAFVSFAPLLLPILLILMNTVFKALELTTGVFEVIIFLGNPIVAVALGLILAIYTLALRTPRQELLDEMEVGIRSAGIIVFVTGGGGALGRVLQDSGIGNEIANALVKTSIPLFLLPFLVATLVRFAQGSGTVAMLTSAGISAPIIAQAGGSMMLGAFAACIGSLFFSYFNDSFYWVTTRLMGIRETKEQIRVWSVTTTIGWAVGFVVLIVLSFIL